MGAKSLKLYEDFFGGFDGARNLPRTIGDWDFPTQARHMFAND